MSRKKEIEVINTLPFEAVFAENVTVDEKNRVIYDTETGLAIGFITTNNDHIIIKLQLPAFADNDLRSIEQNVNDYFNDDFVKINYRVLFCKVRGGYLKIGERTSDMHADLVLPRMLVAGDAAETNDSDQD